VWLAGTVPRPVALLAHQKDAVAKEGLRLAEIVQGERLLLGRRHIGEQPRISTGFVRAGWSTGRGLCGVVHTVATETVTKALGGG